MAQFDELYVVSDLHMGGKGRGFQIFDQGAPLSKLIDELRSRPSNRKVAFCINGDTVDFLAEREPNGQYFDGTNAVAELDRIIDDPSFEKVWKALTRFIRTNNRWLIITLGNHDLELALPWVREHLCERLAGGNDAARGRIELAFEAGGYRCRVGGAKVLCIHGNEVDAWNRTDYEALRRQGQHPIRGRQSRDWTPNAGTKLVIDVMNDVKRRFPFVDLLKPEVGAVLPVLYALDESVKPKLLRIAAVAQKLGWDWLRHKTGFLGDDESESDSPLFGPDSSSDAEVFDLLGQRELRVQRREDADAMLAESYQLALDGHRPLDLLPPELSSAQLGIFGALFDWVTGQDEAEVLREALERLTKDLSFDLKHTDGTFLDLDEEIASDIDFLCAGHTHHERALYRSRGGGVYYNSGTWVRLIRLEPDVLRSERRFRRYFKAFKAGTMDALDKERNLVMRRPAVVSIVSERRTVTGRLQRVNSNGRGPLLRTIERSELERDAS